MKTLQPMGAQCPASRPIGGQLWWSDSISRCKSPELYENHPWDSSIKTSLSPPLSPLFSPNKYFMSFPGKLPMLRQDRPAIISDLSSQRSDQPVISHSIIFNLSDVDKVHQNVEDPPAWMPCLPEWELFSRQVYTVCALIASCLDCDNTSSDHWPHLKSFTMKNETFQNISIIKYT